MPTSLPSAATPSRTSTPNPAMNSNFTSQTSTAEDLLKSQTVGLVHLSDFRKRRAEALEQKEREAEDRSLGRFTSASTSGTTTPAAAGALTPKARPKKKRKAELGKLSFASGAEDLDEDDGGGSEGAVAATRLNTKPTNGGKGSSTADASTDEDKTEKRRLGPDASVAVMPKVVTKSTLLKDAQMREKLRKEFLLMQKAVRATEMAIPFVFYDGTNIPGGICKVKKGNHVWLFLDKARKVGAERGVGGAGERASSKREWARVGVDDLLLVRGEVIIPHHYEFYYFVVNRTKSPRGGLLFDYSAQPTAHSPPYDTAADIATLELAEESRSSSSSKRRAEPLTALDQTLEGYRDDATYTKVVDRRWYERNKHIFPASVWEEFDPDKDYSRAIRRDPGGNAFFFS